MGSATSGGCRSLEPHGRDYMCLTYVGQTAGGDPGRYRRHVRIAPALAATLAVTVAGTAAGADFRVTTPRENIPVIFGTPRVELRVPERATFVATLNGTPIGMRFRREGDRAVARVDSVAGLRLGRNTLVAEATEAGGEPRRITRRFYGVRRDPTMVTIGAPRAGAITGRGPVRFVMRTGTPALILRAWLNHREVTGRLSAARPAAAPDQVIRRATLPASLLRPGGNVLKVRAIGPRGRYETEFRPFKVLPG